jgi:NAD(P)-dependent dehydrogenase (short-subunit alcohol dehydrogenase family)
MRLEHTKVRAGPERRVEDFRSRALRAGGRLKTVLKLRGAESIAGAITLPVASNSKRAERTELMKVEKMLATSRGCAVVFGSTAGYHSSLGNPAYAASKAGLHMLGRK